MNYETYVLQALDDMALCIEVAIRYLAESKNMQLEENKQLSLVNKTEIYNRMNVCAKKLIDFKSSVDECQEIVPDDNEQTNTRESNEIK